MSVAYLDTSVLIKHYVTETGSDWLNSLLSSSTAPVILVSHLVVVEAACAFARRAREGILSKGAMADLLRLLEYDVTYQYHILGVTAATIETARRLATEHPLRAYDAVHLATAWLANQELVQAGQPPLAFFSADDRLLETAQIIGLVSDNPNRHV